MNPAVSDVEFMKSLILDIVRADALQGMQDQLTNLEGLQ
jgi:hypothetical protein